MHTWCDNITSWIVPTQSFIMYRRLIDSESLGQLHLTSLRLLLLMSGIEPNPGPTFTCPVCKSKFSSVSIYADHVKVHPRFKTALKKNTIQIPCCFGCDSKFMSIESFQSHITRYHPEVRGKQKKRLPPSVSVEDCGVKCPGCDTQLTDRDLYLTHMAKHIVEGLSLHCPLCKTDKHLTKGKKTANMFSVVSTFRTHTARYHPKENGDFVPPDPLVETAKYHGPGEFLVSPHVSDLGFGNNGDSDSESNSIPEVEIDHGFSDNFLKSVNDDDIYPEYLIKDQIARYYLKLESEFILPSTEVQDISSEIKLITELSHHSLKKTLLQQLKDRGMDETTINSVIQQTFKQDPVFNIHHKNEDVQQLSSIHLRDKFFKENYPYVAPKQIKVGTDDNDKSRFAHFVSIREALTILLKSERVRECVRKSFQEREPSNVLKDYTDGSEYREHMKQHPDGKCLQLHLFQDGFDFDAFGPTQGLYKINGFYYTLGNLPPQYRSKVNLILLAYLIMEKDMKPTQQEEITDVDKLKEVLKPLIDELEDLKINGIEFEGEVLPVCLMFLIGDSLGQHQIGGFVQTFNTEYSCRFCPITKTEFQATPWVDKPLRTPEQYDHCCETVKKKWVAKRNELLKKTGQVVKRLNTTSAESSLANCSAPGMRAILKKHVPKTAFKKLRALHFEGVKYRPSPFNSDTLKFHVCAPAMPVCLAHDFFEGIVKLVLAKILAYFIDKKKWFSLETLNRRIRSFKCKGSDARDAPTKLKKLDKLSGNACENWNFLRLLPLIIGDLIQDEDDPMWQLFLSLKEICELICAPSIAVEQTAYLKLLYRDFLVQLQKLLPECLIPKAHFGNHYSDFILRFGPLIRLFTLRFESKHVFFKKVADACNNFTNITKTLSKKYMYRFAYDNSSEILPDDLQYDTSQSLNLNVEKLPEEILANLPEDLNYEDFETIPKVIFHSVAYEIGDIMVLDKADNALDLKIGKISVICLHQNKVYFIFQEKIAVNSLNGFYTIDQEISGYSMKALEMLPDYYPLPVYIHQNRECIVLKHSNPTMI